MAFSSNFLHALTFLHVLHLDVLKRQIENETESKHSNILMYGYNAGQPMAIPIYTVLTYCVIHLVIAAIVPVVEKHGLSKVLKPFVEDLNVLAEDGMTVVSGGVERTFRGTLLLWLGDNLGSNTVGGFKQSFSFSQCFQDPSLSTCSNSSCTQLQYV